MSGLSSAVPAAVALAAAAAIAVTAAIAGTTSLLAAAFRVVRARRAAPSLPPPAGGASDAAATTVLLPLRDEAGNVESCLASLLAQEGSPAIRAVDDGSTDGTGALLATLAAAHPERIATRTAPPIAAGLTGKVNALDAAFEGVATDWILLTDADARHAPSLLARAHAARREHALDALSLAGTELAHGAGENLLTPPVFALLDALLGDWAPHARGEAASPVANGQYFLVRTAALRTIGGFAVLRGQPLDDVALARALAAGGFRVGFRRAGGELRVRMYEGAGATFRGWRRNLALVLGERRGLALALGLLAAASVAAPIALLALGFPLAAFASWLAGVVASAALRATARNAPGWGLLFPLDLASLAVAVAVAVGDRKRGRIAAWRGRALGAPVQPAAAPDDPSSAPPSSAR